MKLALGTAQFGLPYGITNARGQVSLDEGREIVRTAEANGVQTLDTAMTYGDSERLLGAIGVDGWQIITKLPAIPEGCADVARWVDESVRGSLAALRVESVYGLLLHRPTQLLDENGSELFRALQRAKADGLVGRVGISIYAPDVLDAICAKFELDLVQSPLNLIDRRLIESGWLDRLTRDGVEVHVRSVFLQGLLLMKANERPPKFDRWSPLWSAYDDMLRRSGASPLKACLSFALSIAAVSKVIVGIEGLSQLKEILDVERHQSSFAAADLPGADEALLDPSRWASLG